MNLKERDIGNPARLTWVARLGLGMVVGSFLPWLLLPALPFLPLSLASRAFGAGALLVTAEVLFWLGTVLAGQEMARRYRDQLKPQALWRRIRSRWCGPA